MLIGNVGRDPEVKYVDAGVCVASVRLATTASCFGANWQKWSRNTCIRATNSSSKDRFTHALTMTRTAFVAPLRRFGQNRWRCFRPSLKRQNSLRINNSSS